MRAVILDGTRNGREAETRAREVLVSEVETRVDEVTTFPLREMNIRHCLGCFGCWIKTPGECVISDAACDIARAVVQSDLVVYLTPITFGGYSSELKKALDRVICTIAPDFTTINGETHHRRRYKRYPRLLGVGLLDHADDQSERIFRALIGRNAINMHAPASASAVVCGAAGAASARSVIEQGLAELGVTR